MDKQNLIKYISAFTVGDGGLYQHGKNARFISNQLAIHKDYIDWRAEILSEVTEVKTHEFQPNLPNRKPQIHTSTRTHPIYTSVRNRMYIENKKVVDPHYLKMLDWECLAILFQDDGSCVNRSKESAGAAPKVSIATDNFSYADNWLLKKALKEKLDLEFNVQRSTKKTGQVYWHIRLRAKDYEKFYSGVEQYIQPSFYYKLVPYDRPLNRKIYDRVMIQSELTSDSERLAEMTNP